MTCLEERPIYGTIVTDDPAWTGGARSVVSFDEGCYFGFEVTLASVGVVIGLNNVDTGVHYYEIEHALYFSRGAVTVYERGAQRGPSAHAYDEGARFYIVRIGHDVLYCERPFDAATEDYFTQPLYPGYKLPGEVIYRSTVPSYGTVFLDTSLYATGDLVFNEVAGELWLPGDVEIGEFSGDIGGALPFKVIAVDTLPATAGAVFGELPFTVTANNYQATSINAVLPFTVLGADIELNSLIIGQLPFEVSADSGGVYVALEGITAALGFTVEAGGSLHESGIEGEMGFAVFATGSAEFAPLESGVFAELPFAAFATSSEEGEPAITSGAFAELPFVAFATSSEDGEPAITNGIFAELPFAVQGLTQGDFDVPPTAIGYAELPFTASGIISYNSENRFVIWLTFNDYDTPSDAESMDINEVVQAMGDLVGFLGVNILERVSTLAATATFYNPQAEVAEYLTITTAHSLLLALTVPEAMTAEAAMAFQQGLQVAEQMLTSGQVTTFYEAIALLAEQLQAQGTARDAVAVKAEETVNTADEVALLFKQLAAVAEAVLASDSITNTLVITVLENVSTGITDEVSLLAHYLTSVSERITTWVGFKLGDEAFTGWVMNTEGDKPISEYNNYPFNSFCELDGAYYGASDEGLYLLDGDDDVGDPIAASVLTMMTDFNSSKMKRVPTAYIGYTADGKMVLRVKAVSGGELREHWFSATERTADAPREQVIQLGRGIRSRYWQFELANIDGADFEIDKLELYPVYLNRRV
jgi:hypothetical protein